MEEVNLKKLIKSFLVLALIASSLALIFSYFPLKSSQTASNISFLDESKNQSDDSGVLKPLPSSPDDFYNSIASSSADLTGSDANLTLVFTKQLAQSIVEKNPAGPQNLNGKPSILAPDFNQVADSIIGFIQNNSSLVIPDPSFQYSIINKPTPKENSSYLKSIKQILDETVLSPEFQKYNNQEISLDDLSIINLVLDQTVQRLAVVNVPQPLLGIHQALIRYFNDQKEIYNQLANYQTDPLKAAIVAQATDSIQTLTNQDEQALQIEIQKIKFVPAKISEKDDSNLVSYLIENINNFLISKVQASGPGLFDSLGNFQNPSASNAGSIIDQAKNSSEQTDNTEVETTQTRGQTQDYNKVPVTDQTTHDELALIAKATKIETTNQTKIVPLYRSILSILIKTITHQLIKETVDWINNPHGDPQYITNWTGFLSDTANQAGGQVLSQILPQLCRPFQAAIQIALQPGNVQPYTGCTLEQASYNIQQFADDFNNGGWLAYSYSLEPQNNFFGAYIQASDLVSQAQNQAANSAMQESIANNGLLPMKVCDTLVSTLGPGGGTFSGDPSKFPADSPQCAHSHIVTPGVAMNQQLGAALNADMNQYVNAQDIDALISAVTNALITNIIKAAKNGFHQVSESSGFSYNPFSLFRSAKAAPTPPRDSNALKQNLQQVVGWLSAKKISRGMIDEVVNQASTTMASLDSLITQLTAFSYDVSPATCKQEVHDDYFGPIFTGLTGITSDATTTKRQMDLDIYSLSSLKEDLAMLQKYDSVAASSSEPLLDQFIGTSPPTLKDYLNQAVIALSSAADVITLNNVLTDIINKLQSFESAKTLVSGSDVTAYYQNFANVAGYTPRVDPAAVKAALAAMIAEAAHTYSIPSGTYFTPEQAFTSIVNENIDSALSSLIDIASSTTSSANSANSLINASTTLNDIQNNIGDLQTNYINPRSAYYQGLSTQISLPSDSELAWDYNNELSPWATSTKIYLASTTSALNLIDPDTASQLGITDTASSTANSFHDFQINLASSTADYIKNVRDASTTGEISDIVSIYYLISGTINDLSTALSTTLQSISSSLDVSGATTPLSAQGAITNLQTLINQLSFNNLAISLSGKASKYSNATQELQTLAKTRCGLKHETNTPLKVKDDGTIDPSAMTISNQLQYEVNRMNGKYSTGGLVPFPLLVNFLPPACERINHAAQCQGYDSKGNLISAPAPISEDNGIEICATNINDKKIGLTFIGAGEGKSTVSVSFSAVGTIVTGVPAGSVSVSTPPGSIGVVGAAGAWTIKNNVTTLNLGPTFLGSSVNDKEGFVWVNDIEGNPNPVRSIKEMLDGLDMSSMSGGATGGLPDITCKD